MNNTGRFPRKNKNRPFRPGKTRHFQQPAPQEPASAAQDKIMHVAEDAIIDAPQNTAASNINPKTAKVEIFQDAEAIPVQEEGIQETPPEPPESVEPAAETPIGSNQINLAVEIEKLQQERDTYLEMARRERADFDNYRKRVEREKQQLMKDSLAGFLKEFFTPLDDMDRVLNESKKNQSFESLIEGVRLMEENFWRVFGKVGVRRIDAMGKQFDPNEHEAMAAIPVAGVAPNTVMEVYQNGYKIDDHVLRPARVIVSRSAE